jgi:hypothetical protein
MPTGTIACSNSVAGNIQTNLSRQGFIIGKRTDFAPADRICGASLLPIDVYLEVGAYGMFRPP